MEKDSIEEKHTDNNINNNTQYRVTTLYSLYIYFMFL